MDVDLIQTVNKLQEALSTIGGDALDLPQIVVVGSQSSGKSSVLETIVGKDFLPRGAGIVTRRPLILQLINLPPAETPDGKRQEQREFGEFLHVDGRRYYDFQEIRKEIEAETIRVTGMNKAISKLPIQLKLYSEHVLNLTLVDLPGLTKIPVGDQPSDIEKQIRTLVTDYISKPNCIILAISPANVDLANSDSLKLARTVDPQGRRTVGVLTKLDLMDQGTNALDILTGRVYPLKLGFIGVVNRSQQDITSSKPMPEAIEAEAEFFRTHPAYRNISHRCGTKYLAKTLNTVLTAHIRDKLPDMKARLNTLMGQTQHELAAFGDSTFQGEQHRGSLILKLMTQFVRDFVASIDGTSLDISTKELCGGARIYYIFNDVFGNALESIDPTHNLTVQDIRTAIRNSTGPRPSLFVPEIAFDLLVKPQIKLLEPPSLRCVELVYEELMKICHNCTSAVRLARVDAELISAQELQRYPRLHAQLIEVVSELLRERLGPTSEYVSSLIGIQAAYINTNHPAFIQGTEDFARKRQAEQQAQRDAAAAAQAGAGKRRRAKNGAGGADATASRLLDGDDALAEESDPDDDEAPGGFAVPNGRTPSLLDPPKSRTVSSSVHDRSARPRPSAAAMSGSASQPGSASHSHHPSLSGNGPNAPGSAFLNYFFGGSTALAAAGGAGAGGRRPSHLSDGGALSDRRDNPLAGRRGLEGSAAAFDMRSLDKHLEAAPAEHGHGALANGHYGHDREDMETSLLQSLIASYFSIVRQTIGDVVPKAIMHLLVNHSRDGVQQRLVASLYKESLFSDLLFEDETLTQDRNRVKAQLDAYRAAFRILSEGV